MSEIKIPTLAEGCFVYYDGKLCKAITSNIRLDEQKFDAHFINPDTGAWDMMYNIPFSKFKKTTCATS